VFPHPFTLDILCRNNYPLANPPSSAILPRSSGSGHMPRSDYKASTPRKTKSACEVLLAGNPGDRAVTTPLGALPAADVATDARASASNSRGPGQPAGSAPTGRAEPRQPAGPPVPAAAEPARLGCRSQRRPPRPTGPP
jgi:hypothetical protein